MNNNLYNYFGSCLYMCFDKNKSKRHRNHLYNRQSNRMNMNGYNHRNNHRSIPNHNLLLLLLLSQYQAHPPMQLHLE